MKADKYSNNKYAQNLQRLLVQNYSNYKLLIVILANPTVVQLLRFTVIK